MDYKRILGTQLLTVFPLFRLPRGVQTDGRATTRDLPECGSVGATEPELGHHLPAVVGQEGQQLRQVLHRTQGVREERAKLQRGAVEGWTERDLFAVRIQ